MQKTCYGTFFDEQFSRVSAKRITGTYAYTQGPRNDATSLTMHTMHIRASGHKNINIYIVQTREKAIIGMALKRDGIRNGNRENC